MKNFHLADKISKNHGKITENLPFLLKLFYFVFEGNFPSTSPRGLIFGGAI